MLDFILEVGLQSGFRNSRMSCIAPSLVLTFCPHQQDRQRHCQGCDKQKYCSLNIEGLQVVAEGYVSNMMRKRFPSKRPEFNV